MSICLWCVDTSSLCYHLLIIQILILYLHNIKLNVGGTKSIPLSNAIAITSCSSYGSDNYISSDKGVHIDHITITFLFQILNCLHLLFVCCMLSMLRMCVCLYVSGYGISMNMFTERTYEHIYFKIDTIEIFSVKKIIKLL